jgi:predicted metal-dependent phosphotriesterase family hydrolase
MSFVRTVLGDIAPADLGVCSAHEHVIIDRSFTTHATPDFLINEVAAATAELRQFRADGGRAMVDSMPCDSGRNVAAAARANRSTGCPILTHTEQGEAALEQVECLRRHGVDLRHVCLSHTDRRPDVGRHRELLASGVRVEFDSAFRWKAGLGNPTKDLVVALLPEFPDQIMLGMDAARRGYWRSYGGGPGLSYLLTDFSAQLRAMGVSAELLEKIFVSTPASTFTFCPP